MNEPGGLAALRPTSLALLKRARRAAGDDAALLAGLRDDLAALADEDLVAVWAALQAAEATGSADDEDPYRVVDKARRKLLVTADRFQAMLLEEIDRAGGAPPPDADARSLKALVAAFCDADRGEELADAARAIVRARSFAYDIT